MRLNAGWPRCATARWEIRPAPMIAACGGTMTRLANRPPIIPKFDSVMVAPRSSSGGIDGDAEIDARDQAPFSHAGIVPGIESWFCLAGGGDGPHQADRYVLASRPIVDVRFIGYGGGDDLRMGCRHALGHRPPHAAQSLGSTGL